MDISKASNFERFIWDAVDQDGDKVAWLWKQVDEEGGFDLSTDKAWEKIEDESGFVSGRSAHDEIGHAMCELGDHLQRASYSHRDFDNGNSGVGDRFGGETCIFCG